MYIEENAKKNNEESNVHSHIILDEEERRNDTITDKQRTSEIIDVFTSSLMLAFLKEVACSLVTKTNVIIIIEPTINGIKHRSKKPTSVLVNKSVENIVEM